MNNLFDARAHVQRPVVRNPVVLTLYWLSKTDARLCALCSHWARATQSAFGGFVLFAAVLAFGSAYYTLSTLNAPSLLVPWGALGWACFIGLLDREIAGGLGKATAFVRPFLALFIGTLVAIPIELGVFQQRVDQELQRQYRKENKQQLDELKGEETKLDQRRAALESTLVDLQKQDGDWAKILDSEAVGRAGAGRTGVAGIGPAFQNAQAQQSSLQQRIEDVRRDLGRMDQSLPEERQRLESRFHRQEIGKVTDFTTRFEAMDRVIRSSSPLYRLSWLITLALILIEMTMALLKILTPHSDYHHLVRADMRENVARIDEISDRNFRLAIENPEAPQLSVSEKFAISRFSSVPLRTSPTAIAATVPPKRAKHEDTRPTPNLLPPPPRPKPEFDQSYLDQLRDSLLHLFGGMPRPTISIKPSTAFNNTNAHCKSAGKPSDPCEIEFNAAYLGSASEAEVENTMKHELVHAWIWFREIKDSETHGHVFILKARQVGCDVGQYEKQLGENGAAVQLARAAEIRFGDR